MNRHRWIVVPQRDGSFVVRHYLGERSGKQLDARYTMEEAEAASISMNYNGTRPPNTRILNNQHFDE